MQTERRRGRPRSDETEADLLARLATRYPVLTAPTAFQEALANPHMLASVVQDVVKVTVPQVGRGVRTMPDNATTAAIVADLRGEWSVDPFPAAFAKLCGHQSAAGVAARTGLDRYKVLRLRKPAGHPEHINPTMAELEAIAAGYRINPMYFSEYRLGALLSAIATNLTPERTASLVRRIEAP